MSQFKYTQVIIFRSDLKIPKGKLAVQAGHASIGAYLEQKDEDIKKEWFEEGQRKLALKADCVEKLELLKKVAQDCNIPAYLVEDLGLTVFNEPTVTCLGLGPCKIEQMDIITKLLSLY